MKIVRYCYILLVLPVLLSSCTSLKSSSSGSPGETQAPPAEFSSETKNVLELVSQVERAFEIQDCGEVLKVTNELKSSYPGASVSDDWPAATQVAYRLCQAKAHPKDLKIAQAAVDTLTSVSFRYPVYNESWYHSRLGDLYAALDNRKKAVKEKKLARDFVLSEQHNVSILNAQILKLNPNAKNVDRSVKPESNVSDESDDDTADDSDEEASDTPASSPEEIKGTVRQFLDNGTPEQAISLIDALPAEQKTSDLIRLRKEAVSSLITKLRYQVRLLYERAINQTGEAKTGTLKQCEKILEGIIDDYSDYPDIQSVKNNLKQVRYQLSR